MRTHFEFTYIGAKPVRYNGLYLPVFIRQSKPDNNEFKMFWAIWDTGSNITALSEKVVTECNMVSDDSAILDHYGKYNTKAYSVDIRFSEDSIILKRMISALKHTSSGTIMTGAGELEIDILLGMNVILKLNLSIKNFNDKTIVTFDVL